MRKRPIEGRKSRISAVITAAITIPRMRTDSPKARFRRRWRRTDSAGTVTSAVIARVYRSPGRRPRSAHGLVLSLLFLNLGRRHHAIIDAVGAIGGNEPQAIGAMIIGLRRHRLIAAVGRQRAVECPRRIGGRAGRRSAGRDACGVGLVVRRAGGGGTDRGAGDKARSDRAAGVPAATVVAVGPVGVDDRGRIVGAVVATMIVVGAAVVGMAGGAGRGPRAVAAGRGAATIARRVPGAATAACCSAAPT